MDEADGLIAEFGEASRELVALIPGPWPTAGVETHYMGKPVAAMSPEEVRRGSGVMREQIAAWHRAERLRDDFLRFVGRRLAGEI